MANKDVLKITFDANAGIKELEQNLIGSMNGMSEEISKKLEEAFAKAGRNPKLKKQLTGIYQGLFDEFGSAAGDLKEIENAVDRFAGKIDYLNTVARKSGNKGLLDNLSIENINKVLRDYDKLIEKQNEINRLQSNEFRDNKRSETTIKSLKELERTYGDVDKAKEKYEDKVNDYLKNVGVETSAISKEIKEYSSLIALFDKISSTKVANGSDEAIKKSQALLYVMQKITDLENGNTLFSNFRLNESDIKGITSSLTVLTQEVEGSITSLVNGMKRNLNKQISEIFENAVAEAEKMSQHQFKVDVKTQAKITNKNNGGTGTGTGDDIPSDFTDNPEGFDVWTESAKELEDEFRDVIKYASDVETALARINEIWDKYANGKGKLLEGETDEMFALMKRLDSLVQNKVIDKSPLSKDQLEEFEPILWDDNYEKVFDRIDQLTSKQIARIEELKAAQKDVGDGSGSVGGVGNIDNSKVEELSKEIAEVKEDISSLKGRVDTLEDTTAFDTLSSKVEGFDEKIKNVDGSVENLVSAFKLLSELSLTDLQKVVIPFFNGINQLYKENNGNHISGYWDKLKEEIEGSNTELRELLKLVGLYDSKSNGLKIISDGMVNSGGLIGDDRVLIARKNKNDRLEQTQALKKALDEAHASGINVSRILDIIGTKESDVFLEVQETANGNILGNIYGQLDEDFVNTEWLEATDEQVKKLISDMIALQKMGINVESNLTNIMYDKEKGFSFIDMDLDITKFENDAELMEDHMIRIFGDLEDFYLNQNDTANANMIAKARERFEKLSEQVQQSYAEAQDSHSPSKEFEKLENDAVDGIVEGANKNEDRLKNVGKQMADNIKDGFKEGLSEIGTTSLSSENQSTVLSGDQSSVLSGTEDSEKLEQDLNDIYGLIEKIQRQEIFSEDFTSPLTEKELQNLVELLREIERITGQKFNLNGFKEDFPRYENWMKGVDPNSDEGYETLHALKDEQQLSMLRAIDSFSIESAYTDLLDKLTPVVQEKVEKMFTLDPNALRKHFESYGGIIQDVIGSDAFYNLDEKLYPSNQTEVLSGGDTNSSLQETEEHLQGIIRLLNDIIEKSKITKDGFHFVENAKAVNLSTLSESDNYSSNTRTGVNILDEVYDDFVKVVSSKLLDTFIHTHPESLASFSDNDIESAFKSLELGITKQIIVASEEMSFLDIGRIKKELDKNNLSDKFIEEYKSLAEKASDNISGQELQYKLKEILLNLLDAYNIDSDSVYKSTSIDKFANAFISDDIKSLPSARLGVDEYNSTKQSYDWIEKVAKDDVGEISKLITEYEKIKNSISDLLVKYQNATISSTDEIDELSKIRNRIEKQLKGLGYGNNDSKIRGFSFEQAKQELENLQNQVNQTPLSSDGDTTPLQEELREASEEANRLEDIIQRVQSVMSGISAKEIKDTLQNLNYRDGDLIGISNDVVKEISDEVLGGYKGRFDELVKEFNQTYRANLNSEDQQYAGDIEYLSREIKKYGEIGEQAVQGIIDKENELYEAGRRFTDAFNEAKVLQDSVNAIPQAEGTTRLFHYTDMDSANKIMGENFNFSKYSDITFMLSILGETDEAITKVASNYKDLWHAFDKGAAVIIDVPTEMMAGLKSYHEIFSEDSVIPNKYIKGIVDTNNAFVTLRDAVKTLDTVENVEILDEQPVKFDASEIIKEIQRLIDKYKELRNFSDDQSIQENYSSMITSLRHINSVLSNEDLDIENLTKNQLDKLSKGFSGLENGVITEATEMTSSIREFVKELLTKYNVELQTNQNIQSPTLFEDESGQLSFVEQTKKSVDLIEEESGQMSMFGNVAEKATDSAIEGQMTLNDVLNKNIEGQMTLNDLVAKQDATAPVIEPIKDTFDADTSATSTEQHTSDIKAETDAIEENTQALKENQKAQESQSKSKSKNKEVITNPSKEGFKAPTGWVKDVNKAWDNANSENAIKNYEELINKVERYYSLLAKNKKSELTNDEESEFKSLQKQIENATKSLDGFNGKGKDFNEIIKKFKTRIGELDKKSGLTDLYGKDGRNDVFNQLSSDEVVSSKINGYEQKVNDLKTVFLEIKNLVPIDITNQKEVDRLDELNKQFDELAQNLNSDKYDPANQSDINKWTGKISDTLFKNTNAPKEIRRDMEALVEQLKQVGLSQADIRRIKEEFERLESQMKATGKTGDSLGTKIKKKFKDVAAYFATYVSIQDAIQVIRQGFETIKEYDTALTEMNKVSEESISTLKEFQKESFELADSIGTTASALQNSVADWQRLGESLEEAKQSAQDANILFNVSEFGSIDEATESLVSMSQAYKELEKGEIIDVVNNLGNNFAISTDGLATALQNSASALKTAQNDFYESAALTTAANTVVQDPDKVGAGLRTIALRLTGTEAAREELAALGEDVDDFVVTTTSKLDQQIKDLTKTQGNFGVSLLDMNGNYRSTYEVLLDIAKVWDKIAEEDLVTGENRQNALLEMMAGKNRSNILASVLQSPEVLEEAYAYALDSEGSAMRENEAYLESIEAHLSQLKNAWDSLWINENNREVITFFLDLAKSILETVNEFGVLNTLLVGGGGIFAGFQAFKKDGRLKKSSLIFM